MKLIALLAIVVIVSACGSSASQKCQQTGGTFHQEFSHFLPVTVIANKIPVVQLIPQYKTWCEQ